MAPKARHDLLQREWYVDVLVSGMVSEFKMAHGLKVEETRAIEV